MKTYIRPADYESVLAEWSGAYAQIWTFHVSHKRLAIALSKDDNRDQSLYVLAGGCIQMSGPFSWKDACLSIVDDRLIPGLETPRRILDKLAGFEIWCTDVAMFKGLPSAPADPFATLGLE
jgi:hypothetical protein